MLQYLISTLLWSTSFLYRYLVLLGLCHLRSISLPLAQLTQLVAAEAVADHDHHPEAVAALTRAWKKYVRTLGRDLEMASALCAAVLALTIGLLSITSIAEEVVTKTIAFVCMFACATGMMIAFNMRRHLNNVAQTVDAVTAWVCAAPGTHTSTMFTTTPMLLAAPWAWMTWSILSFVAMLMSFVWRLTPPSLDIGVGGQSPGLPRALTYSLYDAGKPKDSDTNQSSSGIVVLPWPSRIIILALVVVAAAHFALTATAFRKLGIPVVTRDAELGHLPVCVEDGAAFVATPVEFNSTAATPGCTQNTPAQVLPPPALVAACA
ncbi:hypothetical protein PsYK624_075880 [Phanerochaete sordida]|uniref:Uncharacterized protein n=1 Tax=Phanerochaete sordida TaxID=48140 RepID=A0A9P3LEE9_9APHY|nr:hypothetical protein PsYK624_075880 [Phanerochaete sordida]